LIVISTGLVAASPMQTETKKADNEKLHISAGSPDDASQAFYPVTAATEPWAQGQSPWANLGPRLIATRLGVALGL